MSILEARSAVEFGDVETLKKLIETNPGLANQTTSDNPRTLLHILSDFPAHRPRRRESAELLIQAGANVNARALFPGKSEIESRISTPKIRLVKPHSIRPSVENMPKL